MLWRSIVGKLWMTINVMVAVVLMILGLFLLEYIDIAFTNAGDVKRLFIYICIIGFLLTTFFAFFLSTKITQPLIELKKAANKITEGDYETRVLIRSRDELGDLANSFNQMSERLKQTIKDLRHEKEHLGSILRSMSDAVITLDADGGIMMTNPQGDRLVQEWRSIAWDDEEGHTPEPLRALFESVLTESREMTSKIYVQNDVFSVVMTPLYSNEVIRGAVAVLRDITEEEKLDKLREDFVANVSHELRTPLAMLQGYSEALLDDIAGSYEERKELAQVINDESMRMGRLVKNLLDLARMETGNFEMSCETVHVQEIVARTVRKFSVYAKERGIELSGTAEDDLLLECADEDRLEQVLTNLVDNALRHTQEGKQIFVRASLSELQQEKAVLIEVEDQGAGIPKEDLAYIFERFYKADKARTRGKNSGTGLGLAIVKNIIDSHDGQIQVQSTTGEGTTFSITIPCRSRKREKAKT
ncbi:ATP-binding protein [Marinicrinis lubricantis]|uniref:histidine kinase n=1 Tax=Marinicrinis lubricantis TaxID=2086470 RepID=A0ABW1ISX2_9BACL